MEDFNESLDLSDFTLDEFRAELMHYIEGNREALKDAPFGLYGVVPASDNLREGAIYCLRQKTKTQDNAQINPLQPYYLIYVMQDGNSRYTFAQPKRILEAMRALCAGRKEPIAELCKWFDETTLKGEKMEEFNKLLDASLKSIIQTYRKKLLQLPETKEGTIPMAIEQVNEKTEFELITWLVIHGE
jgi:hypothetical protein